MRNHPVAPLLACILPMIVPDARATTLHVPGDHPTIQAGLAAALPGDVVEVACGEYIEANLAMPSGVTLRSATGDPDCVRINADGQERCIWVETADASTQIEGLELVNAVGSGGGIYCFDASRPEIRACRFARNLAGDGGGLVAAAGSAPHVVDCEFVDNRAFQGPDDLHRGGAIWSNYSQPVFEDCVIRRNGARLGGGVFAMNSDMTFIRCTLVDNYTPLLLGEHGIGGGVYGENTFWSFTDCQFVRNRAGLYGGAAYLVGPGHIAMNDCELVENSAYLGQGALALLSIEADFVGCLFLRNDAIAGRAGALNVSATSSVVGCTFFGNRSAQDGSAVVWASPILTMTHTIIAGGRGGAAVYCLPKDVLSIACCDIFGNQGGDWVGGVADLLGQDGNICSDPIFCSPPQDDFALNAASPCAPDNSPDGCGLIGALPVACGTVAVEAQSWGALKAAFRTPSHSGPGTAGP